jgi:hypothetical protein
VPVWASDPVGPDAEPSEPPAVVVSSPEPVGVSLAGAVVVALDVDVEGRGVVLADVVGVDVADTVVVVLGVGVVHVRAGATASAPSAVTEASGVPARASSAWDVERRSWSMGSASAPAALVAANDAAS